MCHSFTQTHTHIHISKNKFKKYLCGINSYLKKKLWHHRWNIVSLYWKEDVHRGQLYLGSCVCIHVQLKESCGPCSFYEARMQSVSLSPSYAYTCPIALSELTFSETILSCLNFRLLQRRLAWTVQQSITLPYLKWSIIPLVSANAVTVFCLGVFYSNSLRQKLLCQRRALGLITCLQQADSADLV